MAEKEKKTGIFANWIIKNLLCAMAVALVLLVGAIVFLNVATKHNQELTVPDLYNMTVAEADSVATAASMRVEVVDSLFIKRMRKGAVYRQNPPAGSKVKEGRRIVLTINAINAKKVTMPNLVGCTIREALAEIQSRGLVMGRLIYVHDIATNNVMRQQMNGRPVEPGKQVDSESVVDLVLGLNSNDSKTYVPNLLGLKNNNAVAVVHGNSMNVRQLRFDSTVKDYDDSLAAVVYRQVPEPSDEMTANKGDGITLYLTLDQNKVPDMMEKKYSEE